MQSTTYFIFYPTHAKTTYPSRASLIKRCDCLNLSHTLNKYIVTSLSPPTVYWSQDFFFLRFDRSSKNNNSHVYLYLIYLIRTFFSYSITAYTKFLANRQLIFNYLCSARPQPKHILMVRWFGVYVFVWQNKIFYSITQNFAKKITSVL